MTNAVAVKESLPVPAASGELDNFLQSPLVKNYIKNVLPKLIKTERFLGVFLTTLRLNPKLRECSNASLFACLLKSAQCGLMMDGKEAAMVSFKGEAKFLHMYQGLAKLSRNSGEISDIHADVIYENDKFSFSYGTDKHLTHVPAWGDRGKRKGAYSFVTFKDGMGSFEVMKEADVLKIRDRSEAWKAFIAKLIKTTPWQTDEDEMFKKTVFRRHSKLLPMSDEYKEHFADDFDTPNFNGDDKAPEIEMPRALHVADKTEAAPATEVQPEESPREEQPERATPAGYRKITAKFNGICPGCTTETKAGADIFYHDATKKGWHLTCA